MISYPLTKVKGYIYLNIYCERSLGMVFTIPTKKPQEKFLRFFLEVMQAQGYYTLIYLLSVVSALSGSASEHFSYFERFRQVCINCTSQSQR